jgi:hypothetical protein
MIPIAILVNRILWGFPQFSAIFIWFVSIVLRATGCESPVHKTADGNCVSGAPY